MSFILLTSISKPYLLICQLLKTFLTRHISKLFFFISCHYDSLLMTLDEHFLMSVVYREHLTNYLSVDNCWNRSFYSLLKLERYF